MNKNELVKIRQDTGMTRNQFADYFGIDHTAIWRLETGDRELTAWHKIVYAYIKKFGLL